MHPTIVKPRVCGSKVFFGDFATVSDTKLHGVHRSVLQECQSKNVFRDKVIYQIVTPCDP